MKRLVASTLVCALGIIASPSLHAEAPKPETPTALFGGRIVGAATAKKLLDSKSVFFFDLRSVASFGKGHILGARSAPYSEQSAYSAGFDASKDRFDVSALPADKKASVVFYSDGVKSWKSYKAAVLAIQAGYTNVAYFRGGFDEWSKAGYPVGEVEAHAAAPTR